MTKVAGFEILEVGQWGNRRCLKNLFDYGWLDYKQNDGINEMDCPIITWILAKK